MELGDFHAMGANVSLLNESNESLREHLEREDVLLRTLANVQDGRNRRITEQELYDIRKIIKREFEEIKIEIMNAMRVADFRKIDIEDIPRIKHVIITHMRTGQYHQMVLDWLRQILQDLKRRKTVYTSLRGQRSSSKRVDVMEHVVEEHASTCHSSRVRIPRSLRGHGRGRGCGRGRGHRRILSTT
jgi:hypothetical protein